MLIIIYPLITFSQRDNYEYIRGYKVGFYKACDCNDQIPNINRINKIGYYNEGYTDGNIDGRIYLSNNKNKKNSGIDNYDQFGKHKTDINLMRETLEYKTRVLNERRNNLQKYHDMIEGKLTNVKNYRSLTQEEIDFVNKYRATINKVSGSDLTNNANYNSIINYMNQIENAIYNW